MSRSGRNRGITEKKLKELVKQGIGQGRGESYKPFINALKVSSNGISPRRPGFKIHRIMDFLSRNELMYYFMLEYSKYVVDIREQFPLLDDNYSIDETKKIAEEYGIKYQKIEDAEQENIYVMTTDFLITLNIDGEEVDVARTIKPIGKLNRRVLEKFEIERTYWERRGVDYKIVTEEELSMILYANLEFFYMQKRSIMDQIIWEKIVVANRFFQEYLLLQSNNEIPDAKEMFFELQKSKRISYKEGLTIFKFLVANRYWEIDLETRELADFENLKVLYVHEIPEEESM